MAHELDSSQFEMAYRRDAHTDLLDRYNNVQAQATESLSGHEPVEAREPFQWQIPRFFDLQDHRRRLPDYRRPAPVHDEHYETLARSHWVELEEDLRRNAERREPYGSLEDSTQTIFQEQNEDTMSARPPLHEGLDEYDPPPQLVGYMQSASPFSLEAPPTSEQSFLEWFPKGNATITYLGTGDEVHTVTGINSWMIENRCPLLAIAFEESRSGPQLHLEALGPTTVWPFLRYLYTGRYELVSALGEQHDDVPTSVLFHCQIYRLADIYDLPELRTEAYLNVLRQCEFGCSSGDKPIDLCDAIRLIYAHLQQHEQLIDAVVNYCVSQFQSHCLGEDVEFKELAYTIRPFHQALCRNSMGREFENDTAAAIIRLPFRAYIPEHYAAREDPDVVHYFHSGEEPEASPKKRKHEGVGVVALPRKSALTMALRQKSTNSEAEKEPQEQGASDSEAELLPKVTAAVPGPAETDMEPALSSDDDYDLVPRPAAVEALSTDDESEADEAMPMSLLDDGTLTLPVRSRPTPVRVNSESDEDWTVL